MGRVKELLLLREEKMLDNKTLLSFFEGEVETVVEVNDDD